MSALVDFQSDLVSADIACRIIGGAETPISRATLYRGINAGRLPKPIKIGPAMSRWRRSELQAAVERAAEARGAPP